MRKLAATGATTARTVAKQPRGMLVASSGVSSGADEPQWTIRMNPQSSPREPMIGTTLATTYEIRRIVGEGGMGTVYEALHLRLNKRVAIKVLAHALAGNAEALARFRREAEVTSGIGHPHIVQVSDFAAAPSGEPYFVMEFLDGEDLEHRMQRIGRLSCLLTLHIVKQVASALAAAHAQGVVHRDLKPANIFLLDVPGERDFVKVLDFGVSKVHAAATKLTAGSRLMGTPKYMSREQAQGLMEEVDERTDEWALACIAWEALTGRAPFVAEDDLSVLYQVVYETPAVLSSSKALPPQVDRVLRRALAKDRRDRFSTITDFARAFERAIVGPTSESMKAKRRHAHTLLGAGPRPLPTLRLAFSTALPAGRSARKPRRSLLKCVTASSVTALERRLGTKRARSKWFWPMVAAVAAAVLSGASPLLQAVPAGVNGSSTTIKAAARPPVLLPEAVTAIPPAPADASPGIASGTREGEPERTPVQEREPGLPDPVQEREPGLPDKDARREHVAPKRAVEKPESRELALDRPRPQQPSRRSSPATLPLKPLPRLHRAQDQAMPDSPPERTAPGKSGASTNVKLIREL